MSTQYFIAISTGLLLSLTWIIYRITGFQWLKNIRKKDEKKIIIPSLVFLLSPFFSVWLISILEKDGFVELSRVILPLVTFILGQALTKLDKNQEKREQQVTLVETLILQLEDPIFKSLREMETRLIEQHNHCEARQKIARPDKEASRKTELKAEFLVDEIERSIENTRARLDILRTIDNYAGANVLLHATSVRSHANSVITSLLEKKPIDHQKINTLLRRTWELTIENYERILCLAQELLPDKVERYKNVRKGVIYSLEGDIIRILDEQEVYKDKKIPLDTSNLADISSNLLSSLDYQPSYSPSLDYPATYLRSILGRIRKLDEEFNLQLRTDQELRPSVNEEEFSKS